MRALWRGFVRIIFWSYERGTWPYDVMVVAIVLFVLVTPRKWFHDQPQPAALAATSVQLLSEDSASHIRIYRLDATALPPQKRATKSSPELERETHDALGRTVDDLKDRTFHVLRIVPVLSNDGSVLYYDVTVHL
ncbi:MAG: hypothetical protein ABSE45_09470 [Candidatus Acidiferrales bacterium]|jgi:hypothetical protein